MSSQRSAWILSLLLLTGYSLDRSAGNENPIIIWVLIGVATLLWTMLICEKPLTRTLPTKPVSAWSVLLYFVQVFYFYSHSVHFENRHIASPEWGSALEALQTFALIPAILHAPFLLQRLPSPWSIRVGRTLRSLMVIAMFGTYASIPFASPEPPIDVFYFQKEGSAALLHGENPYQITYTNLYRQAPVIHAAGEVYPEGEARFQPYPPLSILTSIPGYLLGDIRWVHIFAHFLSFLLILFSLKKFRISTYESFVLASLYYWTPFSQLQIELAWTDSTVVASLVLFFALLTHQRTKEGSLAAGLTLAMKQTMIMLLPLFASFWHRPQKKEIWRLLAPGLITCGVFFLWDPSAFIEDLLSFHSATPFRKDGLTATVMIWKKTQYLLPNWMPAIALLLSLGAISFLNLKRKKRINRGIESLRDGSIPFFFLSLAATYLTSLLLSKHAFYNYYFFFHSVLVLALAASRMTDKTSHSQKGSLT